MNAAPEPMSRRAWKVLWIGSLTGFVTSFNLSVMFVAYADLQRAFPRTSPSSLSWVLNLFTIVGASTLILAGSFADRIGRRQIMLTGLAILTVSSFACAIAPSPGWLIAFRGLQAIGTSLATPASLALVLDEVPESRRAFAVASWGTIGGLGAALGPSLGALLIDRHGWPWAFWLNVPPCALIFLISLRTVRSTRGRDDVRLPDPFGSVLLFGGVGLVILGLVETSSWGWDDPRTSGSLVIGALLCGWLWQRCRTQPHPLIDVSIWRYPNVRIATYSALTYGLAFFTMFLVSVQFLTRVWKIELIDAGLLLTPMPVGGIVGSTVSAKLTHRYGFRRLAAIGGALYMLSGLWFVFAAHDTPHELTVWLPGSSLAGLGGGLIWPAVYGAAVLGLPSNRFGVATAFNQTIQRISAAIGVALGVAVINHGPTDASTYRPLFVLAAFGGASAIFVAQRISETGEIPPEVDLLAPDQMNPVG